MAYGTREAWITSAVCDEDADNALVLAESIRRTKSSRVIGIVLSDKISSEKRSILSNFFDGTFIVDGNLIGTDAAIKLYPFGIQLFDKLVYISSNCVLLENADELFEDKHDTKFLPDENGRLDLSLFVCRPNKSLHDHLLKIGKSFTKTDFNAWMKSQGIDGMSVGTIYPTLLAKLSVDNGVVLNNQTHGRIVQMINLQDGLDFYMQLKMLKDLPFNSGVIVSTWLEIRSAVMEKLGSVGDLQGHLSQKPQRKCKNEPIAIVGMSCRYPAANNLEEFWNLMFSGDEAAREPPAFRWTKKHSVRFTHQARKTQAGFLSVPVDNFDARFFGVSPKEAAYMDPQSRLLHEVVWESLEDSGIDPLSLHGSHTGIFTGSWLNDYSEIVRSSAESDFFRTYMGNSIGAGAARLSFLLGLTGPSIATESGCSSAIVALDLAVRSLRSGETNLAVAGGVNLILHPFTSNMIEQVISPDGRCKTFDAKANGFGRAEGCGVLVLKRLSDALRDRDNIWASITGSAVTQEGLSRSMGTPTVHCEAMAMKLALEDANVHPAQVSFVETHGTGTAVGDPMEISAITKAYLAPGRTKPLVIGSVKTNVGHTESCSGITGIMKTVLALQHQVIPKHRNLETLNPEIFLDAIPAVIPMQNLPWPKVSGVPRIAGVSSFGITGTDGHVIIEEAPDVELPKFDSKLERPLHLIKISGKSNDALDELLNLYEKKFSEISRSVGHCKLDEAFANAAFTGNVGRASFSHRAFIVAHDVNEAATRVKEGAILRGEVKDEDNRQICFLFTGQGSQYHGMAKTLYETSPVFRVHFDGCDRTLRENYGVSLKEVLWESDPLSKEISRTIYSQTSIFCVEYCLLRLWESWGINPDYVLGHSLGEFAAAVAAGILDFEGALKLVSERSRLIDSLPRGSMLVIKACEHDVRRFLSESGKDLDLAAINSPEQTVLAGDTNEIIEFLRFLKEKGVKGIILEATHAFHSRHMDPVLQKYGRIASSIKYKKGHSNVQFVSGMEGRMIYDKSEINVDYWIRHTREKVSFVDACGALRDTGCSDYLEVGPQPVLSSFVMMNNEGGPMTCFPSLRRGMEEWHTMLESLGKLFLLGYNVDWRGFDMLYKRSKVSLPFHPFHGKAYWMEVTQGQESSIHPLLGHSVKNASDIHMFQNDMTLKAEPYVKDHRIGDKIVFPGAAYTEMMLVAGYSVGNGLTETLELPARPIQLSDVRIVAPLELSEEKCCRFQTLVELPDNDNGGFRIKVFHHSNSDGESEKWWLHSTARFVAVVSSKQVLSIWKPERIAHLLARGKSIDVATFYKVAADNGLNFGNSFRMARTVKVEENQSEKWAVDDVVLEMKLPETKSRYLLHPLAIDAVFQAGILTRFRHAEQKLHVPIRVGQITLLSGVPRELESVLCSSWYEGGLYHGAICTTDLDPIAVFKDIELLETNVRTIESVLQQQLSSIADSWEETWKAIPSPFSTLVSPAQLDDIYDDSEKMCAMRGIAVTPQSLVTTFEQFQQLISCYILSTFYALGWKPVPHSIIDVTSLCAELSILPNFAQLVRFYLSVLETDAQILQNVGGSDMTWKVTCVPPPSDSIGAAIVQLEDNLSGKYLHVLATAYRHLAGILRGEESALSILFPTEPGREDVSADVFYQNHPGRELLHEATQQAAREVFASSHVASGPDAVYRVLEVGSGTGSMSLALCWELRKLWGNRFELYFTDISSAFFIKAEKKLEEFKDNIKYAVFNVEHSPMSQGIPVNYFDCVMATDVIHATRNVQETLLHLRQTLRPQGTLLFTETVSESREITFVFGLLDGYWRFEDFDWRPNHACVEAEKWVELLERSGFHKASAFKAYNNELALIMGAADPEVDIRSLWLNSYCQRDAEKEWVVFSNDSWKQESQVVGHFLQASGYKVTLVVTESHSCEPITGIPVKTIKNLQDPSEYWNVFGMKTGEDVNLAHGIVYGWGMDNQETSQRNVALPLLHIFKAVTDQKKPPQVFVLTKGLRPVKDDSIVQNPTSATLWGMLKSLKNENWNVFLRCIDFDPDSTGNMIPGQLLYEMGMTKGNELHRVQVAYRENVRHEPRFMKATSPGRSLSLPPSTDRYHLILPKTKAIKDLTFDSREQDDVGESQVEVRVAAYALNFRDIFAILKPSEKFDSINGVGIDFSGEVTRVGGGVTKFKPGDRVYGANFGDDYQLSSHVVADTKILFNVPSRMTLWEAATIPAVYSTVLYSFMEVTQIRKDDTVLIHTASGGVGLAAIQVAKHFGAKIIATAGNTRKRAYLKALGIEHVFHSRDTSYEENIMRVTSGRGVDLVLNSITGPGFKEATLRSCAQGARFIEMSKLSVWTPDEVKELRPDVYYRIVDVTAMDDGEIERLNSRSLDLTRKEVIQPIPFVKFDALDIRQALSYFQKARHIGKVVVAMPKLAVDQGQYKTWLPLFNGDSTYWITGALGGGIGFEVCNWMLGLGAVNVILSGRSPPKPEVVEKIKDMNKEGYNVIVKLGDIGEYDNCKAIIEGIDKNKPLRGIMHCAGVLRDNLYRNQTWSDFEATFTPKVSGTWNLHNLTRHMPMEHFVVFSSITALVGTPSQPNHAAANCFEDAFIHYRHSLGLPGTSINWGQWAQVGVAKEISLTGIRPVSLKRMISGLEETMRSQRKQVCYCDFDSFKTSSILIPLVSTYLDERLWNQESIESTSALGLNADEFWKEMDRNTGKEAKVEVMSVYLKVILRNTLRFGATETIGDNTNIQDLGVDSLMMIELKNSIQTLLGTRLVLTAATIKNCNTVHLISSAIVTKLLDEEDEEESTEPMENDELRALLIDDAMLSPSVFPPRPHGRISQTKVALVTGATGRLGAYLVDQIAKSYPFVEQVICMVRNVSDEDSGMQRVAANMKSYNLPVDTNKLKCVPGNLAKENFGMSRDTFVELAGIVDLVIHVASTSNQVEHYRRTKRGADARSVNVDGIKYILQFATTVKTKHVFFASNILNGLLETQESQDVLPDSWPDAGAVENILAFKVPGLQTSKLIGEILLKQAVERGIPCKVFRFPWIAGESETGCLNPVDNLYILRYLSFLKAKAMTSLPLPSTLIPVDICAKLSLELLFNENCPCEVFNIAHPSPCIEQEFVGVAKEELGIELDIVEQDEFFDRLDGESRVSKTTGSSHKGEQQFFKYVADLAVVARGFVTSPQTFFKSAKLEEHLPNYAREIPHPLEVLRKDIRYLKRTGLLEQFGL